MALSTVDMRERLIEAVKANPVLYDTGHEQHRDNDVRERCWNTIAAALGCTSATLKREWKILRDSLRQALRKSRAGATTKAGAPCRRWRFQARMAFLVPYMTRREKRVEALAFRSMKSEQPETAGEGEGEEWCGAGEAAAEGSAGGAEGPAAALELFFASVCAAARSLPRAPQRQLQREVLHALHRAEAAADGTPAPAPHHPSPPPRAAPAAAGHSNKPGLYDDDF